MLLIDDGLAENWIDGAGSDYLGDVDQHSPIYNNNIHVDFIGKAHWNDDRVEHGNKLSDDEASFYSCRQNKWPTRTGYKILDI